ncbi:Ankyrin repeat-containing domain protein, partial [Metarhizium majus ARSEF 297]
MTPKAPIVNYLRTHMKDGNEGGIFLIVLSGNEGAREPTGRAWRRRHAVQQVQSREKTAATIAAFYFNARGAPLERTPLGFSRSLLHQIISQDRGIRLEFLKLYSDRQKAALNPDVIRTVAVAVGRGYTHKTMPKMVSCLISHGAKLNRCDPQDNNSPFMVALKSGHAHLAKLLRDAGADVDICNNSGECGLHIILDLKGKSQSQEMWTRDITVQYEKLFDNLVTGGARLDVCLALLRSGSGIYHRDRYGRTALHIAARCSAVSTVRLLIAHGFDANDVDKHGQNALHRAAERAVLSKELVGVLLDANCSPYARDRNERTPWEETALQFSTRVDQEGLLMLQAGQLRLWRST